MDVLLSFSKVIGDMETTLCVLFHTESHHSYFHQSTYTTCTHSLMAPIVTSIPALWRLIQCTRQYKDERKMQHIWNALKYLTSISVLASSYLWSIESTLSSEKIWTICILVSSLFGYYWDMVYDWGLGNLNGKFLLREKLLFGSRWIYYLALVLNLLLRLSWSLKLAHHMFHLDKDLDIFLFEILEIIRRFIWVFFRMENQYLQLQTRNRKNEIELKAHPQVQNL
jgi:hypothetical protein